MANPEHLKIFEQGVEVWNAWRRQHRDIRPDLTGADLLGADLTVALFLNATLLGATLTEANLYGANLFLTNFTNANLRQADLSRTNLASADLTGANLSGAVLLNVIFGDTNLTAVRGLETCYHQGPSTLDHRTLARSGPLLLAFLRGCGLPDALIEYLPSLLGEPVQFYSCFISYAVDRKNTRHFCAGPSRAHPTGVATVPRQRPPLASDTPARPGRRGSPAAAPRSKAESGVA